MFRTAPFEAQYAAAPPVRPTKPNMLETLTIQPRRPCSLRSCFMNCAQACLQPRYGPRTLTLLVMVSTTSNGNGENGHLGGGGGGHGLLPVRVFHFMYPDVTVQDTCSCVVDDTMSSQHVHQCYCDVTQSHGALTYLNAPPI